MFSTTLGSIHGTLGIEVHVSLDGTTGITSIQDTMDGTTTTTILITISTILLMEEYMVEIMEMYTALREDSAILITTTTITRTTVTTVETIMVQEEDQTLVPLQQGLL